MCFFCCKRDLKPKISMAGRHKKKNKERDSGLAYATSRGTMVTQTTQTQIEPRKTKRKRPKCKWLCPVSGKHYMTQPQHWLWLKSNDYNILIFLLFSIFSHFFFFFFFLNLFCLCPSTRPVTSEHDLRPAGPGEAQTPKRAGNTNSGKTKYIILKSTQSRSKPCDFFHLTRCLSILGAESALNLATLNYDLR